MHACFIHVIHSHLLCVQITNASEQCHWLTIKMRWIASVLLLLLFLLTSSSFVCHPGSSSTDCKDAKLQGNGHFSQLIKIAFSLLLSVLLLLLLLLNCLLLLLLLIMSSSARTMAADNRQHKTLSIVTGAVKMTANLTTQQRAKERCVCVCVCWFTPKWLPSTALVMSAWLTVNDYLLYSIRNKAVLRKSIELSFYSSHLEVSLQQVAYYMQGAIYIQLNNYK